MLGSWRATPELAQRFGPRLVPDPRRIVARLFVPGEDLPEDTSHGNAVIQRILAMSDAGTRASVAEITATFGSRHRDLAAVLAEHFQVAAHGRPGLRDLPEERRMLIGAYFTSEYAVESAALFNPSMVAHPDQTGLGAGRTRFVMSLRAVGEGHVSSVEFRTGVVGPGPSLSVDPAGPALAMGTRRAGTHCRETFRAQLASLDVEGEIIDQVLHALPERFDTPQFQRTIAGLHPHVRERPAGQAAVAAVNALVAEEYEVVHPDDAPLGERVLRPRSLAERHGLEDVRLVRFTGDDGSVCYHGTYTAYDGFHIAPKLLTTTDFTTFRIRRLTGSAARDKGMALFPRKVGGRYLALSRWDRQTISLAESGDALVWHQAGTVQRPDGPWNLVQTGNCGSPIETDAGWLVLTHGVGPMRTYSISAMLLDRDDPTRRLGALPGPLLCAEPGEQDGYVPNTVYSCGAMRHGDTLVIPFGAGDTSTGFARADIAALIAQMR